MFNLPVRHIRFFTPDVFELSLERQGYHFVSGQCAVLFADNDDSRPYSISSGAQDPVLSFLIRRIPGGALSTWLSERRPGDTVRVSLPFGSFRPAGEQPSAVFVATGVGISPFLSVLRGGSSGCWTCLYGVRQAEDAVELNLLRRSSELHLAVSRELAEGCFHGRVTGLLGSRPLPADADWFLCGYDAMVDTVYDRLCMDGVNPANIHTEVFFNSPVDEFRTVAKEQMFL
jgi:ferredoxin-NADP reductase